MRPAFSSRSTPRKPLPTRSNSLQHRPSYARAMVRQPGTLPLTASPPRPSGVRQSICTFALRRPIAGHERKDGGAMSDAVTAWPMTLEWISIVALAAVLSAGMIILLRPVLARYALARPNARSSHKIPTPQGGGVAVLGATLLVTG